MNSFGVLAQALGVAYAAGINVPATVAILGLAQRYGWVGHLPAGLDVVASPWIIGIASAIYAIEFLVTLLPGLASVWETIQTGVRPFAAAILAAATVYHVDPVMIVPALLLGGGLAATTHGTKLGLRYAIDASPEPFTNAGGKPRRAHDHRGDSARCLAPPISHVIAGCRTTRPAHSAGAADHSDFAPTAVRRLGAYRSTGDKSRRPSAARSLLVAARSPGARLGAWK